MPDSVKCPICRKGSLFILQDLPGASFKLECFSCHKTPFDVTVDELSRYTGLSWRELLDRTATGSMFLWTRPDKMRLVHL